MKEKGFTLVELLGVLFILSIIVVLIIPSVSNVLSKSKETIYQQQINNIINAAYDFSLKNTNYLPSSGNTTFLTLGELKYEGLIEADLKNPDTNKNFPDNLVISIQNVGTAYKYSNPNAKMSGDYLYTVEIDKLKDDSVSDLLPKITLESSKTITKNSDGNYIMTLDLNNEFPQVNYTAISSSGEELTSNVKSYILKNNKVANNIDSSKSGIYKINYSVIDKNGYANISTLNVIVADTQLPTINIPEDTIINKNVTSFDLLKGVSCEDNSGFCEIEFSGEETLYKGTTGKYIIVYTAKDPSGNAITQKRVITKE